MPQKKAREYVCFRECFYQGKTYVPNDRVMVVGEMPNKNFQLASIKVMPPVNQAVSALNRSLQEQLQTYISLNRLDMAEELEKRGLKSVASFPTEDAVALIDELRERYEESQRQGPEVGPDVKGAHDETGEE